MAPGQRSQKQVLYLKSYGNRSKVAKSGIIFLRLMQPKCLLNPIYNVGVENPMSPRDSVCGGVIRPIFPPRSILYMSSFKSKGPRNINVQAIGGFCKKGHFSCGVS